MATEYGRRWASPTNRIHAAQPGLKYHEGQIVADGWLLLCTSQRVGYPWRLMFDNDKPVTCRRCLAVMDRMAVGIRSEYDL
jgi:hypothetical protein